MSWIHIDDVVGAIDFLVQNVELGGPFNLASPGTVTNAEFTKELAKALKRPSFLKLPDFMVKLLFGEMGEALLLKGQRVIPHNLMKAGYKFKFPNLEGAFKDMINGET
jgi:NAD dependent epimerase/dehydratase family enzyme